MERVWVLNESENVDTTSGVLFTPTELFSVVSVHENAADFVSQPSNHDEELLARIEALQNFFGKDKLDVFSSMLKLRNDTFRLAHSTVMKSASIYEARVDKSCHELRLNDVSLIRVSEGYYDRSLHERMKELSALSVNQLCKSLLLKCTDNSYFCVIVQYSHEVDEERLKLLLTKHKSTPVDFRFATEEETQDIADFGFNAVAPVGLRKQHEVQMIIAESIFKLCPPEIFVGGGEVLTKLRIGNVYDFSTKTHALRFDFTTPRELSI